MRCVAMVLVWCLSPLAMGQELRLASVLTDHAVLQREARVPVWGWARPGATVTVRFGGQEKTTQAGADGRWRVDLNQLAISKEGRELRVESGDASRVLKDVLVGDVWLCGGQSNMEWGLGGCDDQKTIDSANHPLIRHFRASMNFASHPQRETNGNWQAVTRGLAPSITAVGYHFARRVHAETGIPIGILQSCVGGTNIELWMREETLLSNPALASYAREMRVSLKKYEDDLKKALPAMEAWTTASRKATDAGVALPRPPAWPEFPFGERIARPRCVTLHNGMIEPLIPYAIKGALWYQGESNANGPEAARLYVEMERALLADWSRWFSTANLPFYQVQLAAWGGPANDPSVFDSWGQLREAQRKTVRELPRTGMAVAIDIGDAADIHPRNKTDVGERLALWALAREYGKKVVYSGPLLKGMRVDGGRAVVSFDHVGGGLMVGKKTGVQPTVEDQGVALNKFAIRGKEGPWRWAKAAIEGETVVCSHPEVPEPVAVRYAVTINPAGANLYNREGLPASPFTTEEW